MAGLATFDLQVRELDDRAFLELLLLEQLGHEVFSPLEEARALLDYVGECEACAEGAGREKVVARVAEDLRMSQRKVWRRLALLDLCPLAQNAVDKGELPLGAAAELKELSEDDQVRAVNRFAGRGFSVKALRGRLREAFRPAAVVDEFFEEGRSVGEPPLSDDESHGVLDEDGALMPGTDWVDLSDRPSAGHLRRGVKAGRTYGQILGDAEPGAIRRAGCPTTGRTLRLAPRELVMEADRASGSPVLRPRPVPPGAAEVARRRDAAMDVERAARARARAVLEAMLDPGSPVIEPVALARGLCSAMALEVPVGRLDWLREEFGVGADGGEFEVAGAGGLRFPECQLLALLLFFYLRKDAPPTVAREAMDREVLAMSGTSVESAARALLDAKVDDDGEVGA